MRKKSHRASRDLAVPVRHVLTAVLAVVAIAACSGGGSRAAAPITEPVTTSVALSVSGSGTGSGTVRSTPAGIDCRVNGDATSGTCSTVFTAGMVVALNATPSGDGAFTGFSGDCSGQTCIATLRQGAISTVAASFTAAVIPVMLTVAPSPASRGSGTITSTPIGISCTVNNGVANGVCSVIHAPGVVVTLTQTPLGNTLFEGWSGDCIGNPCQITMTQPRTGAVTFREPAPGIVTVAGSGTGNGAVTSSPSGISCTITAGITTGICSASFAASTSVTLIGGASNGGSFDGFAGSCTGSLCVIQVTSGITSAVSVGFTAAPQRLTVARGSGATGSGVISSVPAGISCVISGSASNGTCSALFPFNTVVTLQQSSTGAAVFDAWAGACTTDPCQIAMSQAHIALVIFKIQGLTISGGGSGTGTVTSSPTGISCVITNGMVGGTCSSTFPPNTLVTLTSTPSGTNSFSGYTGACNGFTCSLTMVTGAMAAVTAQFAAPPALTLTAVSGSEGGGTITSAPLGIACSLTFRAVNGSCVQAYALNTSVTLTQTPSAGSVFVNWLGACSGGASTCTVSLTQSRLVQALYRLAVPGSVTVSSGTGTGSGSVSSSPGGLACSIANGVKEGICRALFPIGSTLSLIPRAGSGSTFTGFSGSCSGMTCVLTVPENGDIFVTANFSR